jgi:hypothetical protein
MNRNLFIRGVVLSTLIWSADAIAVVDVTQESTGRFTFEDSLAITAATSKADADIALRRLKAGVWDDDQSASFMERVEEIRMKLDLQQ